MKKIISVLLLALVYAIMGFKEPLIPAWNVWIENGFALLLLLAAIMLNRKRLNVRKILSFILLFALLLVMKMGFPENLETAALSGLHFLLFLGVFVGILFLNKDLLRREKAINLRIVLSLLLILAIIYMLRMHLLKAVIPGAFIPVEIVLSLLVLAALVFWNKEQLK
ncbi:MAG: hypothetical protein PHX07_01045 [Candidatus Marinimicrobia bacterium]|nr:hypothetical protein [Candidatus Neomarinimicrobiota bacterium]